ncbi:MAG: MATE family efflux transporter [Lachnospiraceae bacterium]
MKHTAKAMDMCHGPLGKNLLLFSIPLMFSNVLQVLFNLSDVAVVGHFAGSIALGCVGSTTILVTLTTGLLLGMSGGVNAVTARYLGAKDHTRVEKAVHSSLILCLIVGILLLLAGFILTRPIFSLLGTKKRTDRRCGSVSDDLSVRITALAMYNYGNAILSAVGDTKRPLIYLAISGVINIILNLIFVIVFHLDVAGVALASIISQYISAALILQHLLHCKGEYRLDFKLIRLDRRITVQVLCIGIPSAIQYSLFAIANLFVQSAVNTFDHVVVERELCSCQCRQHCI